MGETEHAAREVLVCAAEASGMLTGAFGIWPDPPARLETNERQAWIEEQLAPLLSFVRTGLIEVRHFPSGDSDAYTVIAADSLGEALADPPSATATTGASALVACSPTKGWPSGAPRGAPAGTAACDSTEPMAHDQQPPTAAKIPGTRMVRQSTLGR
jgi:hypothetical protein